MNWVIGILIDAVLLAIVVLCFAKGKKDGFAKTLVSLFGFVIAIVAAGVLCAPAAKFVYSSAIKTPIENAVYNVVESNLSEGGAVKSSAQEIANAIENGVDSLPSFVTDIIGIESKKDEILKSVKDLANVDVRETTNAIIEDYVGPVVIKLVSVLVFIILFIAVWLLCKVAAKALRLVNKLPLIGKLNELLGGLVGIAKGLIVALIISWALVMIVDDGASLFGVIDAQTIDSSLILKTISTYNPLNLVLSKVKELKF